MEWLKIYFLPTFLAIGSLTLFIKELAFLIENKKKKTFSSRFLLRLIRRITGAVIMLLVAFCLWWGISNLGPLTEENHVFHARYWSGVMFLVLLAVFLALWDMMAEIKHIREDVDNLTKESIQDLEHRILEFHKQEKTAKKEKG